MRWQRARARAAAVAVVAAIASVALIGACGQEAPPETHGPAGSPALASSSAPCSQGTSSAPTALTRGTATISVTTGDRQTVVLDRIDTATLQAVFDPVCPARAQAEWSAGTAAWQLTVMGGTGPASPAILSIRRPTAKPPLYADGSLLASDPAPCSIVFTALSASLFAGHADCHGLRWYADDQAGTSALDASALPGLQPFDASITFEGQP